MNKLDAELVQTMLEGAGHEFTNDIDNADVVLLYSCSVRQQAENRVLSLVGTLRKRKDKEPSLLIGVLGCMAQRLGKKLISKYPQIDMVVGTREFHRIADLLSLAETQPVVATEENPLANSGLLPIKHHNGDPRGFVEVMRGCNNFCSYCIVPYVRGREESRPADEIIEEVKCMVDQGAVEITLLGQSVNAYGYDLPEKSTLPELLRKVEPIEGLKRLRFLTSHPKDIKPELFEAMRDLPKVCEYLHVAAQSGSDKMLKAMNRKYTRAHYDNILATGRDMVPGITFMSDFIVGYPGETEKDFLMTLDLVEKGNFQNIFAFRYSPRPGTASAKLEDDVPDEEKERRLQTLLKAQEENSFRNNTAMAKRGEVVRILVESVSKKDSTRMTGRTPQNSIVTFEIDESLKDCNKLIGQEVDVKVYDATALTLLGFLKS